MSKFRFFGPSARAAAALAGLALAAPAFSQTAAPAAPASAIKPGAIWPDTEGKPVNAHGGGVLFHEGTYYWYGEIKQGKTYLPDCNKSWGGTRVDVTGVSCYSSKDLLTWKNEGNALPAVSDPDSDLHTQKVLERPKVIYNAKTKKFVMWFHADSMNYAAARCGVAVSDNPAGPFKYLRSFRPDAGAWPLNATEEEKANPKLPFVRDHEVGQMARDMTVFADDDGKAYLFTASEENATMHVSELTDDYLGTTGKWTLIFPGREMEAPAVFKHEGKYYIIASGCTAWAPNAARSAVADNIFGPWKELGNPARGAKADITFQSQGTYVQPVAGKPGKFIFMADRWLKDDLPDSRYIWLPITFEEGKPVLHWADEWKVD
ncbi:glycoside hydrolase family 43 protein [Haloferula sp. BvORR071]|uniref:glycoside hydrolase family 43 protein n=1 Tax=Haloferula sp. BvORR071 TaxID=1396141 RepID=UPI000697D32A|nr:glycoside hydrolase family 43 protein [Haloferula sp. BvORR071]